MIKHTIKSISDELENLTKRNISVERALDLLEASTSDLEELIAINTMRESLLELQAIPNNEAIRILPELLTSNSEVQSYLA